MQQPVRENMPAFGVGRELHLVDGEKIDIDVARHRLHGRHPIARALGFDLFLARDERDVGCAHLLRDFVVHLARQQPQRQADHAAFVA